MPRDTSKRYWKGIEEREQTPGFKATSDAEFLQPLPEGSEEDADNTFSRRSFLKAAGFSVAGSILASCAREPVEKAIPILVQEENMMPGKAYWYASTCGGCQAGCGILTKNRDGRPVKIEGNPGHPVSKGGLCAVGQAMVLGLYDSERLKQPLVYGTPSDWNTVDGQIGQALSQVQNGVYILTSSDASPSTRAAIDGFLNLYGNAHHVVYDAVSYSAILDAHEKTHSVRTLPRYQFDRAEVIVGLEADFLGTWISPVEFTKGYIEGRTLEGDSPKLSHHAQFEGRMSLTGSNADQRIPIMTGESATILRMLAERLAERSGTTIPQLSAISGSSGVGTDVIDSLADRLWQARGRSLVVCGINDIGTQCLVNAINQLLGNYGNTIDLERPSYQWQSDDAAMQDLLEAMRSGRVNVLLIAGTNPVYSLPDGQAFAEAMRQLPVTVTFAEQQDETTAASHYVCPVHHPLESWGDSELINGVVSVSQPAIRPIAQTRSLQECLSAWTTEALQDDRTILQAYWQRKIYPRRVNEMPFQAFWDQAVHDGYVTVRPERRNAGRYRSTRSWPQPLTVSASTDQFALVLYEKIGIRDGRNAHNPWLQELPDPVTKAVWDNYVTMAPATAERLSLNEGDIVRLSGEGGDMELPVQIQPGQHEQVLAVAVGYGRAGTDRFSDAGPEWIEGQATVQQGETVGENSFKYATLHENTLIPLTTVTLASTGEHTDLALTQTHHTITEPEFKGGLGGNRRNMVRETTLAAYQNDPSSGNHSVHEVEQLWEDDYSYTGHHWGLAIDLNRCTGCSACAVACQAENNVPVVGKDEVYRRREMHWIRIDRYYSGTDENVDVMFQPVMCQHCDHAPCEAVCPVLATVHSDEGVNQQIYNRCVGTRYCANNCPYKVRRFNWFDYWKESRTEHLALNPDITTRTRGVMEKCSLCVQRVQEARGEAKRQDRPLAEGNILTACQQSCPADAIVFGDMNDPESRVSRLIAHPRHYRILEEMNYRPTVGYLTKVRHRT